jgi:tetratricopeptide (TPR) repeat protein
LEFYREGDRLSKEGKFKEAVEWYRKALEVAPNLKVAHEDLGYALYRLKMYDWSAEASKAAIRIRPDFKPFYNLGLVHFATGNWHGAMLAFRRSIELRNRYSWKDEYTKAYYYLGRSLVKLGDVYKEIRSLKTDREFLDGDPINRFELASLYLCVGRTGAAREQHRLIKDIDSDLAKELLKLIKKHNKPA